jgi:hypothetical protein
LRVWQTDSIHCRMPPKGSPKRRRSSLRPGRACSACSRDRRVAGPACDLVVAPGRPAFVRVREHWPGPRRWLITRPGPLAGDPASECPPTAV